MRNNKVRPMMLSPITLSSSKKSLVPISDHDRHAWPPRQVEEIHDPMQDDDDHGDRIISRGARDYWHARRVFLGSYHFSEENNGFKEKLRRSVKGLNEAAMGVIVDIRRELSKRRRAGIRVFKFRLVLPTMVLIVRCFTPWLKKVEQ